MSRFSFLLFLCPLFAFGSYIGNPASPSIMNTGFFSQHNPLIKGTTGYIADYISDKHYETSKKNPDINLNQTFRDYIIHSQLASFSVILLERLELFGTVGGSKQRIKGTEQPSDPHILVDFESSYQFIDVGGC